MAKRRPWSYAAARREPGQIMLLDLKNRRFTVTTSFAGGALVLHRLEGTERLSEPFKLEAELLSEVGWVDGAQLLGQPMTFRIELARGVRTLSGIVTAFGELGGLGRYARFSVVVEPWLALLRLTSDCRIFQHKTVPDVVKEIFRDLGFSDFEEQLVEAYEPREYIVQYRESALDFVHRLLAEEGIYYFFRHEGDRHHLVLADSSSLHQPAPGYERVPFYPPRPGGRRERDHLHAFDKRKKIQPGRLALSDYDFMRPRASLLASASAPHGHAHAELEVYDYPGGYTQLQAGEAYARLRLERLQVEHEQFEGSGNLLGVGAGHAFTLTGHPHPAHNREYLVTSAKYDLAVSGYETGEAVEERFDLSLMAIDARRPFRPAMHRKPVVGGLQNAVVVGPGSEEIWTDKYGRVKLQFPWDRLGKKDASSGCWVRVAQLWAGNAWGVVQLPRVGQEVLVEFLEGDPDRPIVTGRVYNEDNKPPYALPDNKTQSGLKSRSTKGGTGDNFNEIRFEDKKGEEELYVHAERNHVTVAKADQSVTVGANRSVTVSGAQAVNVKKKVSEAFEDEHELKVTKKVSESFAAEHELVVAKTQTLTLKEDKNETVSGTYALQTDKAYKLKQGGTEMAFEGDAMSLKVAKTLRIERGSASFEIDESGKVTLKAPAGIVIECGGSKIALSPGDIQILAAAISAGANASKLDLNPGAAMVSAPMVQVSAQGIVTILGSAVKLNS